MTTKKTLICYAKRTPVGKLSGALSSVPAPKLSATLIKDAVSETSIDTAKIDEVLIGNVLTAGIGQAPARQAAIYGGLPASVRATTIGRVCGSGLKSIMYADQAIRLGDSEVVFAGGQENMSLAPHLLPNSRAGYRFGSVEVKDSMQWDGLWDPYNDIAMGNCGELCAKEFGFSREAQDEYATESYRRSKKAIEAGYFRDQLVSVEVTARRKTHIVSQDEEPFSVDLEKIPHLRAAFEKDGTITAANASSINDGAALTILASEEAAKDNGLEPLARISAQASFAGDPQWFTTAPIDCTKNVLKKAKLAVKDIDLWEINEAFAVVPMAAMKKLDIPHERMNVDGGAVSLGHPIGCSGTRIVVSLIHSLRRQNLKRGVAAICIGGGEASAVVVELV